MKVEEKIDELRQQIESAEVDFLERVSQYRLSDAIREGCSVSDQAYTWGDGDNLCALSAAVVAAKARGYK